MKYYINPVNINYRYQFIRDQRTCSTYINREAADPSMILFKGRYYIFASMTLGVWVSDDLVNWDNHRLPDELPLYDYAPDVRVMGEYVYFCASRLNKICDRYRTKDILNGPYEKIEGSFPFWDPNLFVDDDGRVYFYWGCTNTAPIYGTELDPVTMNPIGETKELIFGDPFHLGYERVGENHALSPASREEIEAKTAAFLQSRGISADQIPPNVKKLIAGMFSNMPYIEGAWMDKHDGKYYLQYAFPGTEYNIYGDGVYISENPLGPFTLAENAPYSYKPGGFLPGAGHGSTMKDQEGNVWHAATMRISTHHIFERRVGIFPAGWDQDGELFCNQRYGDWPMGVSGKNDDPWRDPAWYLLSYKKAMSASSFSDGHEPEKAADENIQTWWRAESSGRNEYLEMDLGGEYKVNLIQINFADDKIDVPFPEDLLDPTTERYIDPTEHKTQWKLTGSLDGKNYFLIQDKSDADTDLPHDTVIRENGIALRYLRLSDMAVPYGQHPCVSGLRVFGIGDGDKPKAPKFTVKRTSALDMEVRMESLSDTSAVGYNVLWGSAPDKLYHSYMVFGDRLNIGALVEGRSYFVRVDAFNESGITEGSLVERV